uniref:Helicase ATP-binding domain-containing protein n=1 Tax=Oryza punctata TaxID=4537 RepID=A0A0E0MC42_ORYPU
MDAECTSTESLRAFFKERNARIFEQRYKTPEALVEDIKEEAITWREAAPIVASSPSSPASGRFSPFVCVLTAAPLFKWLLQAAVMVMALDWRATSRLSLVSISIGLTFKLEVNLHRHWGHAQAQTAFAHRLLKPDQYMFLNEFCKHCVQGCNFIPEFRCTLTDEQLNVMKSIFCGLNCKNKHIGFVLAPPGSGKTHVMAVVLAALYERRVALCVPTIADAHEYVSMMNLDSVESLLIINEAVDEYANVVLYWKIFVKETINSLRKYKILYEFHVKKNYNVCFLKFFETSFSRAFKDLKKCLEFITKRLPANSFYGVDDVFITQLLGYLEEFGVCLKHQKVDENVLKCVLNLAWTPENESNVNHENLSFVKDLNKKRVHCLVLLQILKSSLKLKGFSTWVDIEDYLLRKSKTVVCTTSSCSVLSHFHEEKKYPIELLIVEDATKMTVNDILKILHLSEDGSKTFGNIMFKKMLSLNLGTHRFTQQHCMHPSVSYFINKEFYNGKIIDSKVVQSPDYNGGLLLSKVPCYSFLDIPEELGQGEIDSVLSLVNLLSETFNYKECALNIGVLSNGVLFENSALVSSLPTLLGANKLYVEVQSLENFDAKVYDVLILSLTSHGKNMDGFLVDKQRIILALTRTRSGTIWKDLLQDAQCRNCLIKHDDLPQSALILEPQAENPVLTNYNLQLSPPEFSWVGLPRKKYLLVVIRNQGTTETCAFHSSLAALETHYKLEAASDEPPRNFPINLCEKDLEDQYEEHAGYKLGSEKKGEPNRLENTLNVLKLGGVLGKGRSSEKLIPVAFRTASFKKYKSKDLAIVCKLLEENKVMAGHFRLSRNYFSLNSKQMYEYDPLQPIVNPASTLICSYAVLIVGSYPTKLTE